MDTVLYNIYLITYGLYYDYPTASVIYKVNLYYCCATHKIYFLFAYIDDSNIIEFIDLLSIYLVVYKMRYNYIVILFVIIGLSTIVNGSSRKLLTMRTRERGCDQACRQRRKGMQQHWKAYKSMTTEGKELRKKNREHGAAKKEEVNKLKDTLKEHDDKIKELREKAIEDDAESKEKWEKTKEIRKEVQELRKEATEASKKTKEDIAERNEKWQALLKEANEEKKETLEENKKDRDEDKELWDKVKAKNEELKTAQNDAKDRKKLSNAFWDEVKVEQKKRIPLLDNLNRKRKEKNPHNDAQKELDKRIKGYHKLITGCQNKNKDCDKVAAPAM